MSENNMLYGESSQVKVSFAYGTITQAAADTYPGGVAFGYDADTNAGAIYRMGKLVTSRILDIIVPSTSTNDVKTITVKYVDIDGLVREHSFTAVDENLISSLKDRISALETGSGSGGSQEGVHNYTAGEYIDISTDYSISVKYADLYAKVESDLETAGFAKTSAIKEYVGSDYIDVSTAEDNKEVVSVKYTDLYTKVKSDLAGAGIGDSSTINIEQSAKILAIENSYVNDVSVAEEEDASLKTVSIGFKKRASEGADIEESEISFNVPADKYYENVDSSLNSLTSKVSALEAQGGSAASVVWQSVEDSLAKEQANA